MNARRSGRRHEHDYLPACGHDRWLPLYDPLQRLLGLRSVQRAVARAAAIRPGQRVLDVGCGTGSLLLEVVRRHPDVEAFGLDPDPKALARARRKARRARVAIRWDQGYAQRLPYPDDSFDVVLSTLMFHHLDAEDQDAVLVETLRVLRPGGALLLADLDERGHRGLAHRAARRGRLAGAIAEDIPRRMREAGFDSVVEIGRWQRLFGEITCWRGIAPPE